MTVAQQAARAKEASYVLAALPPETKDRALNAMACALRVHADEILAANRLDLQQARLAVEAGHMKPALYERLKLTREKLETVIKGVEELVELPDPVGRVLAATELDEGLSLYKISCPIGLIGVIFEARPDVVPQIAALAVKSGNAVMLKGGSEAAHTNDALASTLQTALASVPGYPAQALQLIHTREESAEMLALDQYFDLIIPRGGNGLIAYVKANTKIPVLGHADGVCHIYVAASADLEMACRICVDAKTQYPSACNAVETLLLDERWPEKNKKALLETLLKNGVSLFGGADIAALARVSGPVTDWHTEYGEKKLSVKQVKNLLEAISHINRFGSHHTDCILTAEHEEAQIFMDLVDSAGVYHNASTRFADGYRYGFGAEVGISTGKTHARGPVGLEGLTIYKYKLYGNGQVVADYVGANAKPFTHKKIGSKQ
ncbi:glutamate-5-semialdehyde dehydrogenase [Candidatus Avelusimicrobium gallicola]|uniref:Gamma-glutamyl phosphate reductase n=1 Tax=Candidatus Avelusimicrobium gallicola TaxID=2562704 RepID=A0A1Y4DEN9_9BACT|nr:glutamate-5-semialdehyde dehydrogenase [Elusimicrobium sp. An273]OUO56189.1 glutamate-5-semialdehyde dehydrogenase [Elusimicrobium sp. An273]